MWGGTIASRRRRGQVQQVHVLCSEDLNPSPWPQDTASVCESEILVLCMCVCVCVCVCVSQLWGREWLLLNKALRSAGLLLVNKGNSQCCVVIAQPLLQREKVEKRAGRARWIRGKVRGTKNERTAPGCTRGKLGPVYFIISHQVLPDQLFCILSSQLWYKGGPRAERGRLEEGVGGGEGG